MRDRESLSVTINCGYYTLMNSSRLAVSVFSIISVANNSECETTCGSARLLVSVAYFILSITGK